MNDNQNNTNPPAGGYPGSPQGGARTPSSQPQFSAQNHSQTGSGQFQGTPMPPQGIQVPPAYAPQPISPTPPTPPQPDVPTPPPMYTNHTGAYSPQSGTPAPLKPADFMPHQGAGAPIPPPGSGQFHQTTGSGVQIPTAGSGLPTPPPEDNTPANFLLGQLLPATIDVPVPPHSLSFDEQKFLRLLAGSISLTRDEKKRIVQSIPKLRQQQVDELVRIFEEEIRKFAALSKKHVPQLEKLAQKHYQEWMDIETEFRQEGKSQQEQAQADEIRKKLGL